MSAECFTLLTRNALASDFALILKQTFRVDAQEIAQHGKDFRQGILNCFKRLSGLVRNVLQVLLAHQDFNFLRCEGIGFSVVDFTDPCCQMTVITHQADGDFR
ncbi:hypothetical protein GFGA_1c0290 [Gluconobacter frateurii NBRC 103465]|nr:hypothetical protein GFGA_1c0290 [Gluconobacter frateurii NBRC 103465]